MNFDNTVLEKLEKLSHLRVDESRKREILGQLNEIVTYVENLSELDTSKLDASFSTLQGGTPMREDRVQKDEKSSQDILKHSPQSEDNFFIVPAIIE
ncbi:MAG: Asp-tRNA(Asn)/Glu-tRNA(Gln) amidotransferase subunit GatC [Campylobacterales bacterium]|nr:Asp-tRNA(Asn)/Glu-tRNA(Gln) amidotransferase subunit GatC [Campylobacterales bacterium]